MSAVRRRIEDARAFIRHDLWIVQPTTRLRRWGVQALRTAVLVVEGSLKSDYFVLAAALTFKVIFALVPMLVVTLAFLKGFGGLSSLAEQVKAFLVQNMTPGTGDAYGEHIDRFIANINGTAIGVVGFLMLVYCALSLFYTIEKAFNQIWGVRRPRSIPRRFTAYWTVLTVAPVCIAVSIGATTFMQSHEFYLFVVDRVPLLASLGVGLTPYVFSWAVFTAMYLFMPNTKVRFGPAVAGGILAGTAWELAKSLYVWANVNFMSANAFYGSLGAIPVFLMWVYISWIIVLVGCEFAFAAQNSSTYRREVEAPRVSVEFRERLALLLLADISRDFLRGREPRSAAVLAGGLNVPVRLVHELVDQLEEQRLVRAVTDGDRRDPALVPACDPSQTTVGDVLDKLHRAGDGRYALPPGATTERLRGVLDEARARLAAPLRLVTLKDLATAGEPQVN